MNSFTKAVVGLSVLAVGTTAFAQDVPDPNPRPNAWGTNTYYCGDDTQFFSINATVNNASAGDVIVVTDGLYVESLTVDTPHLTIRPETQFVVDATPADPLTDDTARWQSPTFWNPTEGPDANNGYAISFGPNTNNTYVGRPREFRRLASGNIVVNAVPVGNSATTREWASINDSNPAGATYADICNTNYTSMNTDAAMAGADNAPLQGSYQTGQGAGVDVTNDMVCFHFRSRSINNCAVLSIDGKATVNWCSISAHSGFGGGAVCAGANNNTQFVRCTFEDMYANGDNVPGTTLPVAAISCNGGSPVFSGCVVQNNFGDAHHGIIYSGGGGTPTFTNCYIASNNTPISDGIMIVDDGATATMSSCCFDSNTSRYGTIAFDSTSTPDANAMMVSNSLFTANTTIDGQYGAVIAAEDAVSGRAPMVAFDACSFMNGGQGNGTDQGWIWYSKDVHTNYYPECRILNDISDGLLITTGLAGANAEEPAGLFGDLTGDGVVGGADLAALLGAWSQ